MYLNGVSILSATGLTNTNYTPIIVACDNNGGNGGSFFFDDAVATNAYNGPITPLVVTTTPTISGLEINPANVEYWSNSTSSTPIVVMVQGLGVTSTVNWATFQNDIATQGYVTVCWTPNETYSSYQEFVANEYNDTVTLLNYIESGNLPAGNASNIILIGGFAGGCNVLTNSYSNYTAIRGILGISPAFHIANALPNTVPVFLIVGQLDTQS